MNADLLLLPKDILYPLYVFVPSSCYKIFILGFNSTFKLPGSYTL